KREAHYERSSFRFDEAGQRWYFVEGGKPKGKTVVKGASPTRRTGLQHFGYHPLQCHSRCQFVTDPPRVMCVTLPIFRLNNAPRVVVPKFTIVEIVFDDF
ncbi:MAG: hypothetical protein WCO86_19345, partial [Planctomycetota bacterium]